MTLALVFFVGALCVSCLLSAAPVEVLTVNIDRMSSFQNDVDMESFGLPHVYFSDVTASSFSVKVDMFPSSLKDSHHSVVTLYERVKEEGQEDRFVKLLTLPLMDSEMCVSHAMPSFPRYASVICWLRGGVSNKILRAVLTLEVTSEGLSRGEGRGQVSDSGGRMHPNFYSPIPSFMAEVTTPRGLTFSFEDTPAPYEIKQWTHSSLRDGATGECYHSVSGICPFITLLRTCLDRAEREQSKLTSSELSYSGFSGSHFRHFMNNLAGGGSGFPIRYLEIGSFEGSTFTSLLHENSDVIAVAIDAWDSKVGDAYFLNHNMTSSKELFLERVKRHMGSNWVEVVVGDCWKVSQDVFSNRTGERANVFFYDGGHSVREHFVALLHYFESVDDVFVFIVDDWSLDNSKQGTHAALSVLPVTVMAQFEVVVEDSESQDTWHKGVGIFVLCKRTACM